MAFIIILLGKRENITEAKNIKEDTNGIIKKMEILEKDGATVLPENKLKTRYNSLPGLENSLVYTQAIKINIEDVDLMSIRYGLTKKNILENTISQFNKQGIESFDGDTVSAENSLLHISAEGRPQLHIEVLMEDCSRYNVPERYIAFIKVYMKKTDTIMEEGVTKESLELVKSKGLSSVQETIKSLTNTTTWERQFFLIGKLENFAEDERNSLEELINVFIIDYLTANPKTEPQDKIKK